MDKTALVERNIEDGRKLVEALDQAGFQVRAALWFYFSEAGQWRLVVASPLVDQLGPINAYTSVQSVLRNLTSTNSNAQDYNSASTFGISLQDISVVSPKHELVKHLKTTIGELAKNLTSVPLPKHRRSALSRHFNVPGIRLTNTTINNTFIEDAFVYWM